MEKDLSFVLMLSLKEMALRKVAVNLWKGKNALASIEEFPVICSIGWHTDVDKKVRDKISKLVLNESLMKQISLVVTPIGLQIKNWRQFHKRYFEKPGWRAILAKYLIDSHAKLDAPIVAKICWTTIGTLDYKKTAEELVRCEILDIVKRYQLACLYCLDDCIPFLWEELPEEIKGMFYEENTSEITRVNLQFCWPYILKGEESKLDSITTTFYSHPTTFYQHAFEYSAREGNKVATEYFFRKLTQEEKDDSLIRTAGDPLAGESHLLLESYHIAFDKFPFENFSDILCYLLCQMNHEQQMEVFEKYTRQVLSCFLKWPWQDLFLKNADRIWSLLPIEDYKFLLHEMCVCFTESKHYFPKLFQEFFPHSPMNFRTRFVDKECRNGQIFLDALNLQDLETVRVIFRNVNAAERMRLLSSNRVFELLHYSILKGKCNMVRWCLREAELSKGDRERLKEAFISFGATYRPAIKLRAPVQNEFFQLLEEIDTSAESKRSSEDETPNKAKKLCSDE